MSRTELDRENLLRDAVALPDRMELEIDGVEVPIFAGFRVSGGFSLYFGTDFVLHFNAANELRRAFIDGVLLKADNRSLIGMQRRRGDRELMLDSRPLSAEQVLDFQEHARAKLELLRVSIRDAKFRILGQVPPHAAVIERLSQKIAELTFPLPVAQRPNVN